MADIEYGTEEGLDIENMPYGRLVGQEIANKAAIHALQHLLIVGANAENAKEMIKTLKAVTDKVVAMKKRKEG